MKPTKKNNFFTFICSFVPGAVEMYMGFMKCGLSLLVIFAVTIAIPASMLGGDVFFVIPVVIYIYSFFHARNLAKVRDDVFETLEDRYIWEEFTDGGKINLPEKTVRKWIAIVLIVFGVCSIWGMIDYSIYEVLDTFVNLNKYPFIINVVERVPQLTIAVLAILGGAKLIAGKKEQVEEDGTDSDN